MTLGDRSFAESVQIPCRSSGAQTVVFRLDARYTRLTATFGVLDGSDGDAQASIRLLPGNGAEWAGSLTDSTAPRAVTLDLRAATELRVLLTCTAAGPAAGVLAGTSVS